MIFTTKGRFAVMALVDIALYGEHKPITLSDIALRQEIDIGYLEQIFIKLKSASFVKSFRGPGGGYMLAKETKFISMLDIMTAVDENFKATRCNNITGCMSDKAKCVTHNLWAGVENTVVDYLATISLEDVCKKNRKSLGYAYFDCNATAPILPIVQEAMIDIISEPHNPSSLHHYGRSAKSVLDTARSRILDAMSADHNLYSVIFTSSGTESNNLALRGLEGYKILCSSVEHASVLSMAKDGVIPVDKDGVVDVDMLEKIVSSVQIPFVVSIQAANNETGVVQPIHEISKIVKKYGGTFHTDATQAFAKIPFSIKESDIDMVTISGHKFGGPQGVAALVIRKDLPMHSIMFGGGQEYRYRPGTQNVAGLHGLGIAAATIESTMSAYQDLSNIRDFIQDSILTISTGSVVFGKEVERLPNTLSITMPNVSSETQVIHFDIHGFAVSAGSACSSGKVELPRIQMSMGYDEKTSRTAIRVSLGINNTMHEAEAFVKAWKALYLNSNNSKFAA